MPLGGATTTMLGKRSSLQSALSMPGLIDQPLMKPLSRQSSMTTRRAAHQAQEPANPPVDLNRSPMSLLGQSMGLSTPFSSSMPPPFKLKLDNQTPLPKLAQHNSFKSNATNSSRAPSSTGPKKLKPKIVINRALSDASKDHDIQQIVP